MVDCVYIAACAADARLTRICVASIRYFYPDLEIRLLAGGRLRPGLLAELTALWGVKLAPYPPGDYGWGFVKLEPLFGPPGESFLVLDSDTVLSGPILSQPFPSDAAFVVDNEETPDADVRALYYDSSAAPDVPPPAFVFNTGQWIGASGILSRSDFDPFVDWAFPRLVKDARCFKQGEQGVLNFALNQAVRRGQCAAHRAPLMCWPGKGMNGITATAILDRTAPARVVHWAGFNRARLSPLPGADVLDFFERFYYSRFRFPAWSLRRAAAAHFAHATRSALALRVRLRLRAMGAAARA